MSLTLYYHPLASFCHKVLIALYENGTEFERRIIDLGDAADSAELRALWPIGKFPIIRDHVHQRNVPESADAHHVERVGDAVVERQALGIGCHDRGDRRRIDVDALRRRAGRAGWRRRAFPGCRCRIRGRSSSRPP